MSERKLYLMAPTHQLDAKHVNMVFDATDIWVEEVRNHSTIVYSQFVFHHPCLVRVDTRYGQPSTFSIGGLFHGCTTASEMRRRGSAPVS